MNAFSEWRLDHPDSDGFEGDLETIAKLLGGEVNGDSIVCPSPGHPADDRSCFVTINKNGHPYIYDCEGPRDAAYAFVRERLKLAPPRMGKDTSAFARDVLSETSPAAGTLVEKYLRARSIALPIPSCLHFHPSLWHNYAKSNWLGMVAERSNVEGYVFAIHRTYLTDAARRYGKAPVDPERMDLGPAKGTAIRLSDVAEELMIGEGIETTLSAMQMYGLPGWSAGSAIMIRELILPPAVKSVIILVDNDAPGENAAREASWRWLSEGRRVRTARSKVGKDFNDWLKAKTAALARAEARHG
jgi:putative DNA primase/helicase